jgi:hypothetical protein
MVGNDQVEANTPGMGRLIGGTNPTIHRNDQTDAILLECGEGLVVQPVTFIKAVRDIATHVGVQGLESLDKQSSRRHPIHIIIAIDGNRLMLLERIQDAPNRSFHAGHLEGRGVEIGFSAQKGTRFGITAIATVEQQLLQNGRESDQRFFCLRGKRRRNKPAFGLSHANSINADDEPGKGCCII